MATNMEIDTLRAVSVLSNVSSTKYTEWIQALANNSIWADQVEISKS